MRLPVPAPVFRGLSASEFKRLLIPERCKRKGAEPEAAALLARAEPGNDEFVARSNVEFGWGRLFGGQPLGQGLAAACQTVPPSFSSSSVHATFLREGKMDELPRFSVQRVRDGRSFATRRVRAWQSHGDVLDMLVDFHIEESGFDHQHKPLPSEAATRVAQLGPNRPRLEALAAAQDKSLDQLMPLPFQSVFADEAGPVMMRSEFLCDPFKDLPQDPTQQVWLRLKSDDSLGAKAKRADPELEPEPEPDAGVDGLTAEQVQQCVLAFSSDFAFLSTSLLPHGTSIWKGEVQAASLSHTVYFHRKVNMGTYIRLQRVCLYLLPPNSSTNSSPILTKGNWTLYDVMSPSAAGARGFVRGEMFDSVSGELVASTMQDGLIRRRESKPKDPENLFR